MGRSSLLGVRRVGKLRIEQPAKCDRSFTRFVPWRVTRHDDQGLTVVNSSTSEYGREKVAVKARERLNGQLSLKTVDLVRKP